MKPAAVLLWTAALVLLATTRADDEALEIGEDEFDDGDQTSISKISASLKISDGLKNRTEMIQRTSTAGPISGKSTNLAINQRMDVDGLANSTRALTHQPSLAISRIMSEEFADEEEDPEALPEAQELRFHHPVNRRRPFYRPNLSHRGPSGNRRNVFPVGEPLRSSKRPNRRPQEVKEARQPTESDCTFFTKTVCLETTHYPHDAIARSLRGNKDMVSSLLTDFSPQDGEKEYPMALPLEGPIDNRFENKYENNEIKRRADYSASDNVEEGFTCPSQVVYARPQLARAVSGVWKYIINTGEHTQTLRLEKCSTPKSSCSFISDNYRSSCVQVYNYHRLLTWDSSLGLHMDIFKVPSCCSCHVQGYAELYPPHQKDPRPLPEEKFPGIDFATEQSDSEPSKRPNSYLTKFKPSNLDNNFGITSDANLPSYLEYPPGFNSKFPVSSGGKHIADAGSSHRPSFALPGRTRLKKPASANPRPFDKLPQQHAPNTRAPGYKGPTKSIKRPIRPQRPYRRESTDGEDTSSPNDGFNHHSDQDSDATTRLQSGFDDEYQEPNRRVNYNYHPIIDFFKPEASRLQAPEALTHAESPDTNGNSWKPMISP